MKLKDLSRDELEKLIAEKGIGSDYLNRAERIQIDVNLALLVGSATVLLGLTAWTIYKYKGE
jgi:hypothetical protein